jgi:hypothetical protein
METLGHLASFLGACNIEIEIIFGKDWMIVHFIVWIGHLNHI